MCFVCGYKIVDFCDFAKVVAKYLYTCLEFFSDPLKYLEEQILFLIKARNKTVLHCNTFFHINTCNHQGNLFCNISIINIVFIFEILYIAFQHFFLVCIFLCHLTGIVMLWKALSQEQLPSYVSVKINLCSFISFVFQKVVICLDLSSFCYVEEKHCLFLYYFFKLSEQIILK